MKKREITLLEMKSVNGGFNPVFKVSDEEEGNEASHLPGVCFPIPQMIQPCELVYL